MNNNLLNDIITNNDGTVSTKSFNPDSNNDGIPDYKNIFAQEGLIFTQNSYLSNGFASTFNSVNDFRIFNPYVHYAAVNSINSALQNVGIKNVENPVQGIFNVFDTLTIAQNRFEIYNRNFRKSI
jgi:hypothetical protein